MRAAKASVFSALCEMESLVTSWTVAKHIRPAARISRLQFGLPILFWNFVAGLQFLPGFSLQFDLEFRCNLGLQILFGTSLQFGCRLLPEISLQFALKSYLEFRCNSALKFCLEFRCNFLFNFCLESRGLVFLSSFVCFHRARCETMFGTTYDL